MGTTELQEEIKRLLGKLKWSQKKLGRELYHAKYDDDDFVEISRYEEKVKKDLIRKSTKTEVLESYMDIIVKHEEFQKLDIMVPTYQKTGVLSERMESGMNNISRLVGELISK
ncbi:hypothetical protein CWB96_22735 [Pseudoalteromonas citrea]|uniref:Uncharacterized protein n=1 Tax=Pseudoalteromonas citrea TaxID=43655 RepID=A0A5S3XDS7_9GAMM|nr:hypothetical protein [Pseudoalteromonas citrea]TMP39936.1 hypothetical protein CWB97_20420 [Pseudoalteromonas citrea]TMP50800.1 hypothetical protein CWB96_22735 [Pseudoalteromonas citrea]